MINELSDWAHTYAEPAVFVVFFTCFAGMALYERFSNLSERPAERLHRWPANIILTSLFVLVSGLLPLSLLVGAEWASVRNVGLFNLFNLAAFPALILGIVARSFISFATHYAMHKIPILWRVHRVHHLDTQLDVSTTVRFHPLEPMVTLPFGLLGVVTLGISPLAILIYEIFDAAITTLTHANVKWPRFLERWLRYILVTPELHRVHHSIYINEYNSNYGATLSVWDRLFGTLREKSPVELDQQPIGVKECCDKRTNNVLWLLISPAISLRQPQLRKP